MKKLLIILVFAVVAMAANAQRGRTITLTSVDIEGAETVDVGTFKTTGSYNSISISTLCTQLGGTSDGTLSLYGSNDGTNYSLVNGIGAGFVTASPQASITGTALTQITITNALVANWVVEGSPFRDWKITGAGTTGDTTQTNITVVLK